MRIELTSVFVDDQERALRFYTELLLEPSDHPAVRPYREALMADGIPLAVFAVDDIGAEHARLVERGVRFTQPPTEMGPVSTAVFEDGCGNLIQLQQSM